MDDDEESIPMDKALGEYYKQCGRDDYYDEYRCSKFIRFMHENEFEEEHLEDQLGKGATLDNCDLIEMDDNFPLLKSNNNDTINKIFRKKDVFEVLQHCDKYGLSPITHGKLLYQGGEFHEFE